jgi:hypothetical protein
VNPEEKEACRSVPEWLRSDDAADLHIVDRDLCHYSCSIATVQTYNDHDEVQLIIIPMVREKELSYPNYKKYMIRRSMAIGPACTYGLPSLNNLRRRQAKATKIK